VRKSPRLRPSTPSSKTLILTTSSPELKELDALLQKPHAREYLLDHMLALPGNNQYALGADTATEGIELQDDISATTATPALEPIGIRVASGLQDESQTGGPSESVVTSRQGQGGQSSPMDVAKAAAKAVFDKLDVDDSGELDLGEFTQLCCYVGLELTPTQASALFKKVDLDESDLISFEEFYKWYTDMGFTVLKPWWGDATDDVSVLKGHRLVSYDKEQKAPEPLLDENGKLNSNWTRPKTTFEVDAVEAAAAAAADSVHPVHEELSGGTHHSSTEALKKRENPFSHLSIRKVSLSPFVYPSLKKSLKIVCDSID
jgi:hypothetical protein